MIFLINLWTFFSTTIFYSFFNIIHMKKIFLIMMALSVSLGMMAQDKLSAPTKVFLQRHAAGMAQNPDGKHALAAPKSVNGVEYVE